MLFETPPVVHGQVMMNPLLDWVLPEVYNKGSWDVFSQRSVVKSSKEVLDS